MSQKDLVGGYSLSFSAVGHGTERWQTATRRPLAPDSLFAAAGVTQVSITIPPDPKKATAKNTLPPEA